MKRSLGLLKGMAAIFLLVNMALAETKISGLQSGEWKAENNVYIAEGDLTVPKGLTLTINPGVIVKFHGEYSFIVDGDLLVAGTPDQKVIFTSFADDHAGGDTNKDGIESGPTPLDWNGILVRNSKATVRLKNVKISNCLRPLSSSASDVWLDSLFTEGNSISSVYIAADTVGIADGTAFSRRFPGEIDKPAVAAPNKTASRWYRKPFVIGGAVVGTIGAATAVYLAADPSPDPSPAPDDLISDPPGPPF